MPAYSKIIDAIRPVRQKDWTNCRRLTAILGKAKLNLGTHRLNWSRNSQIRYGRLHGRVTARGKR